MFTAQFHCILCGNPRMMLEMILVFLLSNLVTCFVLLLCYYMFFGQVVFDVTYILRIARKCYLRTDRCVSLNQYTHHGRM